MPTAELLRAAEAGELGSPAEIRSVALRMLDNPQTKRSLEVFLAQWMRFDRVMAAVRSACVYSDFSNSPLPGMTEETRHLCHHMVWGDVHYSGMSIANYTFCLARLAFRS